MTPVDQTKFMGDGWPKEDRGNCLQAGVASLLDLPLDGVPDFNVHGEKWWIVLVGFARCLGFDVVETGEPRDQHGLMIGRSPRNEKANHCVIALGSEVVHDPHPSRDGIVGDVLAYWYLVERPIDERSWIECPTCEGEGGWPDGHPNAPEIPAFEDDPVAMALGFTPRKPGVKIPGEPDHCARCAEKAVRALCAEVYTPEGVEIWMTARNRTLGGRTPMDLIAAGEAERVLQVLEQLTTGAFS